MHCGRVTQDSKKKTNKRVQKAMSKRNGGKTVADYDDQDDGADEALDGEDSNIINVCGLVIDIEKISK